MATMTDSTELSTLADPDGRLYLPPAAETPATGLTIPDGIDAAEDTEVMQAVTPEGNFGELEELEQALREATGDADELFAEDRDAAEATPDDYTAAVTNARRQVAAALDETDHAADNAGAGNGDHDTPSGGSGGNRGNGGGEGGDDDELGDEGEESGESSEGFTALCVPENFGQTSEASHQDEEEIFSGSQELPDGSTLHVNAKVMGDSDTGDSRGDRPILGVRVVGDAHLAKDDQLILKVDGLTMVFPYDTRDPELAALGRQQQDDSQSSSEAVARRTAEATIAAMEAMRANERNGTPRGDRFAETERPDRVNERTRQFITDILGSYPNVDLLTQAEGTEIAEQLLEAYRSNWGGSAMKDIRERRENIEMARQLMTGRSKKEVADERGMQEWDVGLRVRRISSWMQDRPDHKSGAERVRARLSQMLESKTRPS